MSKKWIGRLTTKQIVMYVVMVIVAIFIFILMPACASESTIQPVDIDAVVEARLAIMPTPTTQIVEVENEVTPTPVPQTSTPRKAITTTPKPKPSPTPTSILVPSPTSVPTPLPTQSVITENFWNEPLWPVTQKCSEGFEFTHKLVDPADVAAIGVSPGSHIAPHDHMAYWGTANADGEKQVSEKVQLYSPADIFFIDVSRGTKEWGANLYTCNGHSIFLGHVSEPSDELNLILSENEPEPGCDENSCRWLFPGFIPAGTLLFRANGYTSGFDFALNLLGLTVEELQQQPGYGYSITPWRTGGSGSAVCALEYFEEPLRSEYMKKLGDFNCGPFNQDVPGTAMGFWLDTPSPDTFPGFQFKDEWEFDEWNTIWLFQDFRKTASLNYNITVGNNTFGLVSGPHAEYSYIASQSGLVNRAWDNIKPGENFCVELKIKENMFVIAEDVHKILIVNVSEDGNQLTVEAIDSIKCGGGPWEFQGGGKTFYR